MNLKGRDTAALCECYFAVFMGLDAVISCFIMIDYLHGGSGKNI